jgi:penicillin-binding protein 1A
VGKRRDTSFKRAALEVRLTPDDPGRRRAAKAAGGKTRDSKTWDGKTADSTTGITTADVTAADETATESGGGDRPPRSVWFRVAYWCTVLLLWVMIGLGGLFAWVGLHLPPIQSLKVPKRPPSIEISASDGRVFARRGEMGGAVIQLSEMPDYLPKAFIAIEDRRFYDHHGVDPVGLVRALMANLLHRNITQGGSTITQQLAKNFFLTRDRNMMRKLQEVMLSLWLEHKFTKDELLELYLNRVYFGAGAYGVEAAAQRYFGKSARNVSLSEAALLAGLVKSPSRLAPTRNYDGAERRAQVVLGAMTEAGLLKQETAQAAMVLGPSIVKPNGGASSNYVADWVMDVLNDAIGLVDEDIVVETTIDPALQEAAERAVLDQLTQNGSRFGVEQGALVAITPDGAVRALVGGRNYAENQFNRAVAAKRQPGSAFKPFVYLTAIERGLTPQTIREDGPIEVNGWRPENFSHGYLGPVTLTHALSGSLNSVAVRLTVELGPDAVVLTAHRLGIASKLDANPSIALGTSEVSVLEMVSAYAPFANGGFVPLLHVVERVRTARGGKTLYARPTRPPVRVVDSRSVVMMNAMMRETVTSGTARRTDLPGWPVAGKTGTSQEFRDAWFIGYTGQLVTGVWLGNDDNTPMRSITGGGLPVEVWSQFMKAAHKGKTPSDLPGVVVATVAAAAAPALAGPATAPAAAPPAPRRRETASREDVERGDAATALPAAPRRREPVPREEYVERKDAVPPASLLRRREPAPPREEYVERGEVVAPAPLVRRREPAPREEYVGREEVVPPAPLVRRREPAPREEYVGREEVVPPAPLLRRREPAPREEHVEREEVVPPAPPTRRREPREGREARRPMEPPGDNWHMDRWFEPR